MKNEIKINGRRIGPSHNPLVIAEIGINHEGSFKKAIRMINDAHKAGCECVKFQTHVIEDEMIPNKVVPGNTTENIWDIISRCQLSEEEDRKLKKYVESKGTIYLSTPFSRAAADRLRRMKVDAYKIGSGECNNYPLIEHIAKFGKPVILSTGMNNIPSIKTAVKILNKYKVPHAILHCTSIYPTPYDKVRLGALSDLKKNFPGVVFGLSDHSIGNYTSYAAVALGASIIEKHFTSDKKWPGPDISISIDSLELKELIKGTKAIHEALGGNKNILNEEKPTIDFAYACVVSIKDIKKNELLSKDNIWVKRPGTGQIKAVHFSNILGKKVNRNIKVNKQLKWSDFC
jgi:N-acetylneuraminate synthase